MLSMDRKKEDAFIQNIYVITKIYLSFSKHIFSIYRQVTNGVKVLSSQDLLGLVFIIIYHIIYHNHYYYNEEVCVFLL